MIEINLLPGAGRKSRTRAAGAGFGAALSGAASRVKDPYLLGAAGATALALLLVGGLWFRQSAHAESLDERLTSAAQDSVRYAAVLGEKRAAEARRDSVLSQLAVIRAIDENRFVWPHIMDEVARALPAYTWLTSMNQTSAMPAGAQPPAKAVAVDTSKKKPTTARKPAADTVEVIQAMRFRIVGNTVDIQALTRFMKDLEASAFIQNVVLEGSALKADDGKEVTEFQLSAEYQTPDSSAVRRQPIALSVR